MVYLSHTLHGPWPLEILVFGPAKGYHRAWGRLYGFWGRDFPISIFLLLPGRLLLLLYGRSFVGGGATIILRIYSTSFRGFRFCYKMNVSTIRRKGQYTNSGTTGKG